LNNGFAKADLHVHSRADDGLATPREIVEHAENHTDLDLIAITDHDAIAGAWEARDIVARGHYRLQVMVGMEITTRQGHLLALDISAPVTKLQDMDSTITQVHQQGGLCVMPHPLAWFSMGARQSLVNRLVECPTDLVYLDGVELFNPSFAGRATYTKVQHLNETRWHLARCGGSDSHSLHTIGSAYTLFPLDGAAAGDGNRAQDHLRRALADKRTDCAGQFWSLEDHTSIAVPQMYRSMIVTPGARVRRTLSWIREKKA
jgi:predicted metal-dependent phosphoesterase TrpH